MDYYLKLWEGPFCSPSGLFSGLDVCDCVKTMLFVFKSDLTHDGLYVIKLHIFAVGDQKIVCRCYIGSLISSLLRLWKRLMNVRIVVCRVPYV